MGHLLTAVLHAEEVLTGIDVLEVNGFQELKGKRVGLITNHTGLDRSLRPTALVLAQAEGVQLKALFSPEHGFKGLVEDAAVSTDTLRLPDGRTIPIFSLYGSTQTPTNEMLSGLDALVFDVQDIGARFYTYPTTMALAMEAAARRNLDFVVLDRPNPINGEAVSGPILEDGIRHFTAYFPVSVRHGMTVGELARLHNITAKLGARLLVVPLRGWRREMWFDQTGLPWTKPSPNMPDLDAAALYPGIGCFEATNVSVGRGTPIPFRWVGAPWMKAKSVLKRLKAAQLPGFEFEEASFTPDKSVFQGELSRGVRIRITDREKARPLHLFAVLVCALRDLHPMEFGVRFDEMARMVGTGRFRQLYEAGARAKDVIMLFDAEASAFRSRRAPFLLY